MGNSRIRATSTSDNTIGKERYELYKSAFSWIKKSIDSGFYIEAISITESLIADRLESRISFITNSNYGLKNLGTLIDKIKSSESDEALLNLVIHNLKHWKDARNKAAHEMVKIEDGKQITWEKRVEINKQVAEKGLHLVRQIDHRIRQLRNK